MDAAATDGAWPVARLPGLDIEIMHRRAVEDDAEQISINLRAAPSFEAFGRALEAASPFGLWAQAAQLAWQPWVGARFAMMWTVELPWSLALPRPSAAIPSHLAAERGSMAGGTLHLSPP